MRLSDYGLTADVVAEKLLESNDFNDQLGILCDIDPDDWCDIEGLLAEQSSMLKGMIAQLQEERGKINYLRGLRQMKDVSERLEWLNPSGSYLKNVAEYQESEL